LLLEKPTELTPEGYPHLMFPRTQLGKLVKKQIILKNEGIVPATVKFDPITEGSLTFLSPTSTTILPKQY